MIKADIFENGEILVYNNTVADSVMHEKISFNFPDCWSGYTKTVVFGNGETLLNVILNGDDRLCTGKDECYIPHEVIKAPEFTVSVFGTLGESRITTLQSKVKVRESGYANGDSPSDPTPTVYEQLINITSETKQLADETKQIAQSVRADADNGVFKGEKGDTGPQGEKGEKGEKGDTGEQGVQGIQGEKGDKGDKGAAFTYADFTPEQLAELKGEKGDNGTDGKDGYTPQKGVDYFTDEDIAGLNIPSVDQTYTPDNSNAQSGFAVAQAVAIEQKRADNTLANALKCAKNGSAILVDDVSPITHDMGATVKRNNLFDYDSVGFKNSDEAWQPITIVKENNSFQFTNTDTGGAWYAYTENISEFGLMPNTTYTSKVIATLLDNGSSNIEQSGSMSLSLILQTNTSFDSSGKGKLYIVNGQNNNYYKTPGTYELITTFTTPSDMTDFKYIATRLANNTTIIFKNLQIELGTTATAYTPYVPDLTAVKVRRCGKNLFGLNDRKFFDFGEQDGAAQRVFVPKSYYYMLSSDNNYYNSSNYRILNNNYIEISNTEQSYGFGINVEVKPKEEYVLSCNISGNGEKNVIFYDEDGKYLSCQNDVSEFIVPDSCKWAVICLAAKQSDETVKFSNIQLELGGEPTAYEPYIAPIECVPSVDGTVSGLKSIYPNMTLLTDTEGVTINCEYNADTKKYIDNKIAELMQ